MRRYINAQKLTEAIVCFLFSVFLLFLVISRNYLKYITYKSKYFLILESVVFMIWAMIAMLRIREPQYKKNYLQYFIVIIPLLFTLLPHMTIPTISSINLNQIILSQCAKKTENNFDPVISDHQITFEDNKGKKTTLSGFDALKKEISVQDDNFIIWLRLIFEHCLYFEDYTIIVRGQTYLEKEDTFILGRLLMTCCLADLSAVAIRGVSDNPLPVQNNEWYTITGKIKIESTDQYVMPYIYFINADSIAPIEDYLHN